MQYNYIILWLAILLEMNFQLQFEIFVLKFDLLFAKSALHLRSAFTIKKLSHRFILSNVIMNNIDL